MAKSFVRLTLALFLSMPLLGTSAIGAFAKNQALLVGVSTYNGAAKNILNDLKGPRNDVTQMWRYFATAGFEPEDITVLADGIPKGKNYPAVAGKPNYKSIVKELKRLESLDYSPGDMMVFYFSGHGTTQPDNDPLNERDPEARGRDQVLLPADTGMFFSDTKKIKNGLVDDELGDYLARIRGKGARVWAIIDACNSGSSTRSGGGDFVARTVNPEALGVPPMAEVETRGAEPKGPLDPLPQTEARRGDLIGFYAVDEYNLAIERHFEFAKTQEPVIGTKPEERKMGVFTYYLLQALQQSTATNYQALLQETAAGMALNPDTASIARPIADGNLTLPLPGHGNDVYLVRGLLENDTVTIPAGSLQGFTKGAVVTLYKPGKDGPAIATATIDSDTPVSSRTGSLEWLAGQKPQEAGSFPVRVTEPVASSDYRVAKPDVKGLPSGGPEVAVLEMLTNSFGSEEARLKYGVTLVEPGDLSAELVVLIEKGHVWLSKAGEDFITDESKFGKTLSIDLQQLAALKDGGEELLRESIWRLAKAQKLLRAADVLQRTGEAEKHVEVKVGRFRQGAKALSPRDPCPDRKRSPLSTQESQALSDITHKFPTAVGNCDILRVTLTNKSPDRSYHVGAFYVDSRGGVIMLNPANGSEPGCGYTLPEGPGIELPFDTQVATWDGAKMLSVGKEHIVVLAVEHDGTGAMPAFCNLAQATLQDTRTRGGNDAAQKLFDAITGGTRGGVALATPQERKRLAASTYKLELLVRP